MRVMVILIVIGALGTVPKDLKRRIEELENGGRIEAVQITAWEESKRPDETCSHWVLLKSHQVMKNSQVIIIIIIIILMVIIMSWHIATLFLEILPYSNKFQTSIWNIDGTLFPLHKVMVELGVIATNLWLFTSQICRIIATSRYTFSINPQYISVGRMSHLCGEYRRHILSLFGRDNLSRSSLYKLNSKPTVRFV